MRLLILLFILALIKPAPAVGKLRYNRDIRPILSDNCFACHGPDKNHREADLRLDVREAAIEMKAIIPGKPEASSITERMRTHDEDDLMPPPESKKTLTDINKHPIITTTVFGRKSLFHPCIWSIKQATKCLLILLVKN